MTKIKFKNFTLISKEEKELVLKWRNSDRIRSKISSDNSIIPLDDHLKFIEKLKDRKDRKYYLFYVDERPVGVNILLDIDEKGLSHDGASYIGDENYLGYGLLLLYLQLRGIENATEEIISECYVLKNNPRVYKMHKKVFGAKDLREEEDRWYIYWDKEGWDSVKDNLKATIYDPLNIEEVIWEG